MEKGIIDPVVPYIGPIQGQLAPGRFIKIQGTVPSIAYRFDVNLQCGPNIAPRNDVSLHLALHVLDGYVSRNTLINSNWGEEQKEGQLPQLRGQKFEIIILCDTATYKVAINGIHFCEFPFRLPADKVTHLAINGDVAIVQISYEVLSRFAHGNEPPPPPAYGDLTNNTIIPSSSSFAQTQYHIPPGSYQMQPMGQYGMPAPPGPPLPPGAPPPPPGAPPPPPGYLQSTQPTPNTSYFPPTTAYPPAVSMPMPMPNYSSYPPPYSSVAPPAYQQYPQNAYPTQYYNPQPPQPQSRGFMPQMPQSQFLQKPKVKKAMKYGVPILGAGIGAYAMSKILDFGDSDSD